VRHWQRYGSAYQAGDGWGGPPFRQRKRGRVGDDKAGQNWCHEQHPALL
jgi:hypothetical protein